MALIVNARSRRGQDGFGEARRLLEEAGLNVVFAQRTHDSGQLISLVRDQIKREVEIVAVGGGDGSLGSVANNFVGSRSALGLLPLGTGNAFARDLGIGGLAEAIQALAGGRVALVDLGYANGKAFVNVATLGLTTRIAAELSDCAKRRFGRWAYVLAVARGLAATRPFTARLTTPHEVRTFDTLQVVVGNGRFHAGPFPVNPTASIEDGMLAIYALATTSKGAFCRLALGLPWGRHVDLAEVHAVTAATATLEAFPARGVTLDGEISERTPLELSCAPRALPVVVPTEFGD